MPKIREVRRKLMQAGFVKYKDTDHEYYKKELSNGEFLYTKLSHGDGEIPAPVWQLIKKQTGLK